MVYKCTAPGCKQGYKNMPKDPEVSFHCFPQDFVMLTKWLNNIPRDTNRPKPTIHSRLCSKHFVPSDFITLSLDKRRKAGKSLTNRRLRKDAIPSQWPDYGTHLISPRLQTKKAFEKALEKVKLKEGNVGTREELLKQLSSVRLPTGFILLKTTSVALIKLHQSNEKGFAIEVSLEINKDLTFKLFHKETLLSPSRVSQFLQAEGYLLSVKEVLDIANYMEESMEIITEKDIYDGICNQLLNFSQIAKLNYVQCSKLESIMDQMNSIYKVCEAIPREATCAVVRCKTGHESSQKSTSSETPKPTLHNFPTDEEISKKWMHAIPFGETMDVKYSMVCSLHFFPQDFREKSVSCSDGKKRQLLRPDAVPSKFPWCGSKPLPYNPPLMNKRNEPAINPEELLSMNNVTCVKDLRERIPKFGLSSNVLMESRGGILTFIHVQRGKTDAPCVFFSLCVNLDMSFAMYLKDKPLPASVVSHAISSNRIQTCSQVINILASLENLMDSSSLSDGPPQMTSSDKDPLNYVQVLIGEILDALQGVDEEISKSLRFLMEDALQALTPLKARRYSDFILSIVTEWQDVSPALYRFMTEENILALPSVRYMRQLKAKESEPHL